ncbi:glutathione-dependent formaldehyde-activating, GFA [Xylaria intraflava]|nr:glutathione-dependent formaldehyde-activating, GFA [Xylaria intraflava]
MSIRTGSCVCGGIKVEMRGDPVRRTRCHCLTCQKITGTMFATSAIYNVEQVTITESKPSLMKTYEDRTPESGNRLKRSFCGECGSAVKIDPVNSPSVVVVSVGIIDGDKADFKPEWDYYCRNRADWVDAVKGGKDFMTMPPK